MSSKKPPRSGFVQCLIGGQSHCSDHEKNIWSICNMKTETKRFGLEYKSMKERRTKSKTIWNIILFIVIFIIAAAFLSIGLMMLMRRNIACLSINHTIDSLWIGSLASYWGGIIGGVFSGVFAFLGVFFTIKYYKESDKKKEKTAIQPFLLVTVGADKDVKNGFTLGPESDEKKAIEEIKVTIKNIGNGFANTLVIHTGFNSGGSAYNKVISASESEYLFFRLNSDDLGKGLCFGIQYIDAMRNEYIQEYEIIKEYGHIDIKCGYPGFLEQ